MSVWAGYAKCEDGWEGVRGAGGLLVAEEVGDRRGGEM